MVNGEFMEIVIREERGEDGTAVYEVEAAAFGQTAEAELVQKLHLAQVPLISLLTEVDGRVVGHILFSPMEIVGADGRLPALGLGPMAVLPAWQKQGIGGAMIKAGLVACRAAGHEIVFVLGHSDYYPRFGFRPSRPYGIVCEYDVPPEAFMVIELRSGALENVSGVAYYHPAFAGV